MVRTIVFLHYVRRPEEKIQDVLIFTEASLLRPITKSLSVLPLDHRSSHSCLQASPAQYHPEESPRVPVSPTLLNPDPLPPLPHSVPISCGPHVEPDVLSDLPPASLCLSLFLPRSKTKYINEIIFPIMFVNEVRTPPPPPPPPHTHTHTLY